MTRNILARIKRLESETPRQPTDEEGFRNYLLKVRVYSIANYLGHFSAEESPMQAYARALGYEGAFEVRSDMQRKDPKFFERELLAWTRLLADFGVTPTAKKDRDYKWQVMLTKALEQMVAGLPETLRQRLPPAPWTASATDCTQDRATSAAKTKTGG